MSERTIVGLKRLYSIYVIRNTVNDKVYIGQTSQSVEERFAQHKKPSTFKQRGTYKLYNAMAKYGKDAFYVETLESNIPITDIDEKEKYYIELYNSFYNGYNSTKGGDGKTISAISDLEKLSELYRSGMRIKEIAQHFGVAEQTISRTLKVLDIEPRRLRVTLDYLKSNQKAKTNVEMASELGVSTATITRAFQRFGIKRGKGSSNAHTKQNQPKFSNQDKERLATVWYDKSVLVKEIAKMFGVSKESILKYAKEMNLPHRRTIKASGSAT